MHRFIPSLVLAVVAASSPGALAQSHDHAAHGSPSSQSSQAVPTEPGQAAFAAIQEIEKLLEDDPGTDWSRVDLEALRQHLIDMNNVTLASAVEAAPIEDGVIFSVTGAGPVRDSIRRMASAHAAVMDGVQGWRYAVDEIDGGVRMTVRVPPRDVTKVRALGFVGVMAHGMHHQEHHLMIARGGHPHG